VIRELRLSTSPPTCEEGSGDEVWLIASGRQYNQTYLFDETSLLKDPREEGLENFQRAEHVEVAGKTNMQRGHGIFSHPFPHAFPMYFFHLSIHLYFYYILHYKPVIISKVFP
jgi:hypothetical protein